MRNGQLVSIVLPVYNDQDTIEECVESLISQRYPNKELIIVDDGSSDATPDLLKRIDTKDTPVHIMNIEHVGSTRAKNTGFRDAKGDIIFFAEGDAIYNPDYVSKAAELLSEDQEIGAVCVTGGLWIKKPTFVSECMRIESGIKRDMLESGRIEPYYAWVFRSKAVKAVDGFDEKLLQAEDRDLFQRIKGAGSRIGLVTGVNWYHKRDQDFRSYLRRAYNGSKSRILYIMKYRKLAELSRYVIPLWSLALLMLLSIWYNFLFYLFVISSLSYFAYKLFYVFRYGKHFATNPLYLFAYPVFSAMRYLATASGYTIGLLTVLSYRLKGEVIDTSAFMTAKPAEIALSMIHVVSEVSSYEHMVDSRVYVDP